LIVINLKERSRRERYRSRRLLSFKKSSLSMRYFIELAYNGARYKGWQRQPNALSVQQVIEEALSTILRTEIEVTGCGRTDTGVHASQYFLHFDFPGAFPPNFLHRVNKFLPKDIAFFDIREVAPDAHARFDAIRRAYEYTLSWRKDPFSRETVTYYPWAGEFRLEDLNSAAKLLLEYEDFYPFCKSDTDVKTMKCSLFHSEWERQPENHCFVYHIEANRFLRGMVRLIVGMCINVAQGRLSPDTVRRAMDEQKRLERADSAPAEGLFLSQVLY
jgi:tRNA pseudouridine38-40 synthase